jgi:hypothetical protein
LETIDEGRNNQASKRYVVERMMQSYWILEPHERVEAYARWRKFQSDLHNALQDLPNIKDPHQLQAAIRKAIKECRSPEDRLLAFAESITVAPRAGEEFVAELIRQSITVLEATRKVAGPPEHLATLAEPHRKLLERSLFLAAHYDRPELAQALFEQFLNLARSRPEEARYQLISEVARECLRSLRKLGLKDEINDFLRHATDLVVQGKSLTQLRSSARNRWPEMLMSLLALAEGWLFFGGTNEATPVLDEARRTIFENANVPKNQQMTLHLLTRLVQAYISAQVQGPVDVALDRIQELFVNLQKLPIGFTTATHFSRLHLNIVEEVIRSLISDNIALGDQARRWLDDDEFLVRRRIHGDMKKLLAQSGL